MTVAVKKYEISSFSLFFAFFHKKRRRLAYSRLQSVKAQLETPFDAFRVFVNNTPELEPELPPCPLASVLLVSLIA